MLCEEEEKTVTQEHSFVCCNLFSQETDVHMPGRPGARGFGEDSVKAASPSTGSPKICSSSFASGGGIGKRPMAISTRDRPMLQMSD